MNPIFIGMNPSKARLRKGCALFRLYEWFDYMDLDVVAFTNLSPDPYWDKTQVDRSLLYASLRGHGSVVALGGLVSTHLSRLSIEHFTLPHPSPLNRQINDEKFISHKLDLCKNFLTKCVYNSKNVDIIEELPPRSVI